MRKSGLVLVFGALLAGGLLLQQRLRALRQGYLDEQIEEGWISAVAIMEGAKVEAPALPLKGVKVRSIMGGTELDLSHALLSERPLRIDVNVLMGGVALKVPADWRIAIDADCRMGGVADHRNAASSTEGAQPDLVISGKVMMGGLDISA